MSRIVCYEGGLEYFTCDAPMCRGRWPSEEDCVVLNLPDASVFLFCGAKCLWTFLEVAAPHGFEGLTAYREPRGKGE